MFGEPRDRVAQCVGLWDKSRNRHLSSEALSEQFDRRSQRSARPGPLDPAAGSGTAPESAFRGALNTCLWR
jgi:hypothetical protein